MRIRDLAAAAALVACGGTPAATTTAAMPANRAETPGCIRNQATDDAHVDADTVPVAARVGGVIRHVAVTDGQRVEAGALIIEIDDADYAAKLAVAQAELAAAKAQADAADAQVEIAKSTRARVPSRTKGKPVDPAVARAKADLAKAELDYARAKKLHDAGAIRDDVLDAAQASRVAAQAAVDAANANLAVARDRSESPLADSVEGQRAAALVAHAHVQSAAAAVELATLELGYTRITAPIAGVISRLGAREGQLVQPNMPLLMVVPEATFVIATFKETQMDRIALGDPVEISIDGKRVLRGKVDSIAARFTTLPPDGAPGNLVQVGHGVPVKIVWNDGQKLAQLHAGLAVAVNICLQK